MQDKAVYLPRQKEATPERGRGSILLFRNAAHKHRGPTKMDVLVMPQKKRSTLDVEI